VIESHVQDVLNKFSEKKKSIIVGGYLRDLLCGIAPHDVDIATELSIEEVKKLFPQLNGTEKGLAFGIGRFKFRNTMFEISTYPNASVLDSIEKRDFTINSLYFDGKVVHDENGAKEDIRKKIIRPLESPDIHFKAKPEAYIRAIRLCSQLGFDLSNELILFMHQNKEYFEQININRIQQEGYRIIQSAYPLKAFGLLKELRFIRPDSDFETSTEIPYLSNQLEIRLAYMASLIGVETMYQFIDLFQLSKRLKEKIHYLSPYFSDDQSIDNPYIINEVILLKRYQYYDQPEKLRNYLSNMKKR